MSWPYFNVTAMSGGRKIFYVDTGEMPEQEAKNLISQIKNTYKKVE